LLPLREVSILDVVVMESDEEVDVEVSLELHAEKT
jgi:hypothetical protein